MTKKFYDTNVFLDCPAVLDDLTDVVVSTTVIDELENIKTSSHKDDETKFKARRAVRAIREAVRNGIVKIAFNDDGVLAKYDSLGLEITNDMRIISSVYWFAFESHYAYEPKNSNSVSHDLIFYTKDALCYLYAKMLDFGAIKDTVEESGFTIRVVLVDDVQEKEVYKGYKFVICTDEQLAEVYAKDNCENIFECEINEYAIIQDNSGTVCDIVKWTGQNYSAIGTKPFKSRALGNVKPLDEIQRCAFDSIVNNDITVLFGRSGSGKTTIPLSFIMQGLEKQTYRKCIIVYDFETLRGARQLGFTPGTLEEKILTQGAIGNILGSKLGDVSMVERMMASDTLQIVPTANIRGMEIGADTVCYVTEAQNLDPYTLKTIVQRCKSGSKIILEGDVLEQRDVDRPCGLFKLIDVFKGHKSFGCVKLKNNYRSEIAELADLI